MADYKCPACRDTGYVFYRKFIERLGYEYEFVRDCDMCDRAQEERAGRIRASANVPSAFYDGTMQDFDWNIYTQLAGKHFEIGYPKKVSISFVQAFEKWAEQGKGLYIHSKSKGTGKTFLASCICNTLINEWGVYAKFVSAGSLLNLAQEDSREGHKNIRMLIDAKLLVLDDFGQKRTGMDWLEDVLFKIIDARMHAKKPTIYTSNVTLQYLNMDERIKSRIIATSVDFSLPEVSVRENTAKQKAHEFLRAIGI